jgi:hypothetical protein
MQARPLSLFSRQQAAWALRYLTGCHPKGRKGVAAALAAVPGSLDALAEAIAGGEGGVPEHAARVVANVASVRRMAESLVAHPRMLAALVARLRSPGGARSTAAPALGAIARSCGADSPPPLFTPHAAPAGSSSPAGSPSAADAGGGAASGGGGGDGAAPERADLRCAVADQPGALAALAAAVCDFGDPHAVDGAAYAMCRLSSHGGVARQIVALPGCVRALSRLLRMVFDDNWMERSEASMPQLVRGQTSTWVTKWAGWLHFHAEGDPDLRAALAAAPGGADVLAMGHLGRGGVTFEVTAQPVSGGPPVHISLPLGPVGPAAASCAVCGRVDAKLSRCSACRDPELMVCSTACFRRAWPGHKAACMARRGAA